SDGFSYLFHGRFSKASPRIGTLGAYLKPYSALRTLINRGPAMIAPEWTMPGWRSNTHMVVSEQTLVTGKQLDELSINTIRTLAIDAVQQANSGHPGAPMALAPVAYGLWQEFLRYDPEDPTWPNRDRFVLSNGHASMLLYAMLHLAGVREVSPEGKVLSTPALSLDEIKNFRQIDSKTPGHPEYGLTSGVETTTGPLGQGVANSVG